MRYIGCRYENFGNSTAQTDVIYHFDYRHYLPLIGFINREPMTLGEWVYALGSPGQYLGSCKDNIINPQDPVVIAYATIPPTNNGIALPKISMYKSINSYLYTRNNPPNRSDISGLNSNDSLACCSRDVELPPGFSPRNFVVAHFVAEQGFPDNWYTCVWHCRAHMYHFSRTYDYDECDRIEDCYSGWYRFAYDFTDYWIVLPGFWGRVVRLHRAWDWDINGRTCISQNQENPSPQPQACINTVEVICELKDDISPWPPTNIWFPCPPPNLQNIPPLGGVDECRCDDPGILPFMYRKLGHQVTLEDGIVDPAGLRGCWHMRCPNTYDYDHGYTPWTCHDDYCMEQ
jgi:hypothetical protein